MRVLIVEDEPLVARAVERALLQAGYQTEVAYDGAEGLVRAQAGAHDLIVLDVLLPEVDGLTVCREVRQQNIQTPILLLTARDAVADRVRGLDAGADDYVTKPFATEELLARVRALSRRNGGNPAGSLRVADLILDRARHDVWRGDRQIELTPTEFELLAYLMRHAGQVLSRHQIAENVWHDATSTGSKMVELYIHYLRNKIDRQTSHPLVRTVRGVGYMVDG
ncbi:MAG TPA: response regulator transcription factor [Chloroflexota bacterium]|nr:response regulator transcription factor [Chloroflexota bacterium]